MSEAHDETRQLSEIIPDPKNARRHADRQLKQIAASIKRFGMVEPLVIRPNGQLIGGEGRFRALQSLGWTSAPCRVVSGLTEPQYTALGLALNKIAENSEWSDDALAAALAEVKTEDGLLSDLGFSARELAAALEGEKGWPADRPSSRPVAELLPNARNSRTHSPDQVDRIAKSIKRFGFTNPILIDEGGTIIAGHGRVMAAQKLNIADVPVMVAKGWSEAEKRAYLIADNKLALDAGWDAEMLAAEFRALRDTDVDLTLTGFSMAEIAETLGGTDTKGAGNLSLRFGIPPFSVMNAREGWWQDRKAAWLALGIESEVGRGTNVLDVSATMAGITDPAEREAWNAERRKAAGGAETHRLSLKGGDVKKRMAGEAELRKPKAAVPGNGGIEASLTYRDRNFYSKKRDWETANGRKITTPEFRKVLEAQANG